MPAITEQTATASPVDESPATGTDPAITDAPAPPMVTADLLVEDVSIDGMCGVY